MSQSVLFYFILVVILTEYITGFIKNASILEKPRAYFKSRSEFFLELLNCGYCLSVWVSILITTVALIYTQLPDITGNIVVDMLVVIVVTSSLSNAWHGFRDKYLETYKDRRYYRQEEFIDE